MTISSGTLQDLTDVRPNSIPLATGSNRIDQCKNISVILTKFHLTAVNILIHRTKGYLSSTISIKQNHPFRCKSYKELLSVIIHVMEPADPPFTNSADHHQHIYAV